MRPVMRPQCKCPQGKLNIVLLSLPARHLRFGNDLPQRLDYLTVAAAAADENASAENCLDTIQTKALAVLGRASRHAQPALREGPPAKSLHRPPLRRRQQSSILPLPPPRATAAARDAERTGGLEIQGLMFPSMVMDAERDERPWIHLAYGTTGHLLKLRRMHFRSRVSTTIIHKLLFSDKHLGIHVAMRNFLVDVVFGQKPGCLMRGPGGVEWKAKVRARPYHLPAPSPTSGSLDSVLTPGPGEKLTAKKITIETAILPSSHSFYFFPSPPSPSPSNPPPPPHSHRPNLQTGRVSPLTLAAGSVRSLLDNPRSNRPERRTALVAREPARYKMDIMALRETRFSEQGQLEEVAAGYTFFWSGRSRSKRQDAGVTFAIRNDIVGRLLCLPQGINDRLMTLRFPHCGGEITILVNIFAPPISSPDETRNKFYAELHALPASEPTTWGHVLARPSAAATCWYHTTFGVKARRCISPCSFTSKQNKRLKPVNPKVGTANLPDGSNPGRTFYVRDTRSGRLFLVDTGAQLSVIPPTPADRRYPNPGLFLQAVNTSPITTFGTCSLSLDIGLRRLFPGC
ncbi:hypothetical protein SprV_1002876300 [Sparganum proliferum]